MLALIHEACRTLEGNIPSSVICAVITRWTAHYLAYHRLILLRPALMMVITSDSARIQSCLGSRIVTGNASAQQKAEQMVEAIGNTRFWESLIM